MRRLLVLPSAIVILLTASPYAGSQAEPSGVRSLLGRPLAEPTLAAEDAARMEAQLARARAAWEQNRDDADALIWLGRRTAYLGRYREAITIFG
ncbi:MAG: hypothetical protein KF822_13360, partial [Steroidobacteraceae bacterium]|nr:hypothetical protein [Steroidobacteraceae bacterium]